jgi:NAD(P)-dependent dehydrogenase (short-subunit alcohol dehydrogenase family)
MAAAPGRVTAATVMENPPTRAEFLAKIPMARAADAREIAKVIAFLASDEASFVTGAAWYADGGLSSI